MKVLRPRAHRSASCCKAHCAPGTGECHCCRRPAPRVNATATARPMSSKMGLGFKVMDFRTPQTHLPDPVRSSIPQGLGCRASCLKTQTLGRDLQTRQPEALFTWGDCGWRTQHCGQAQLHGRRKCSHDWTQTAALLRVG